ncbi:hypothetical protein B0T26DRAFT_686264 [Lasiosphaeria miniovina]|uniref:Uncharacterized protein n=1 Tax=Lasiosphaeria miniovina TaxID=1954250 RepID=A0AA40BGN0_9PEZI|nr:uncharacterized protein B0T26DRAFT_686264 [Lasiosphaeria miniovina]KAK0733889.1 hypothetical protein B0T26DRAFT_686264 [Lasiosphaeria miniovina]
MSTRRPETEILVHIAAPARAADDARYRVLAGAYLNFQPRARTSIFLGSGLSTRVGAGNNEVPSTQNNDVSALTATGPAVMDSPQLSFRSVLDNISSPTLRRLPGNGNMDTKSSQIEPSWHTPPSVVPDSLPENNLAISQYCSPTRILEHFLHRLNSTQSDHSLLAQAQQHPLASWSLGSDGPETSQPSSAAFPASQRYPVSQHHPTSQDDNNNQPKCLPPTIIMSSLVTTRGQDIPRKGATDTTEELPTSPTSQQRLAQTPPISSSLPSTAGDSCVPNTDEERRFAIIPLSPIITDIKRRLPAAPTPTSRVDETRIESSYPSQQHDTQTGECQSSSRARSEPPPSKRLRRSSPDPDSGKPLARSSSDIGPRAKTSAQLQQRQQRQRQQRVATTQESLDKLGLEIISPAPPASIKELDPANMVTEILAKMARDLNLERRFKPASQTRDLRPFERGYWLLDCTTWDLSLKHASWKFMINYLGEGCAGWGAVCRRDPAFSWIRLYCWGCVAGHMYLLLYIMSQRKIVYTGAKWIAADGKPVIVMGARAQAER